MPRPMNAATAARICLVLWLPISFGLAGCSTYRAVSYPVYAGADGRDDADRPPPAVGVGDRVEVALQDGSRIKGRVMAVAPEALTLTHGDHVRAEQEARVHIDVDMIQAVTVRKPSPGRTVGLVGIILGTLVGSIAALASLNGGMSVNFGG